MSGIHYAVSLCSHSRKMCVHLAATLAVRPPMTRMVTRSHPCESDTELPMPSKSWRGAIFLFPWASAGAGGFAVVEKINANLRSSLPYLRATQRCPKKDIQPRCVLGISLREEPLHLPQFLLRSCDYFVCSFGLSSTEPHRRFPPRRSFVSIILLFATPASCLRPVESAITVLFAAIGGLK